MLRPVDDSSAIIYCTILDGARNSSLMDEAAGLGFTTYVHIVPDT